MDKTVIKLVKIKITGSVTSMLTFMRGRESKGKGFNIGTAVVAAIIVIAFGFMMAFSFGLSMVMGFQMQSKGCLWLFFPFAFVVSAAFALMGTVFAAQSYLFDSHDNELLLSMPIKPSAVLLSRMLALYLLNMVYSSLLFLPVGVSYGLLQGYTVLTFMYYIVSFLLVPLVATGLSCILGYVIGSIVSKIPNKNMITVIFSFGLLAVLMVIGLNLGPIISILMNNIEIVGENVQRYSRVLYWYGIASHTGNFPALLPMVILCVGFTALIYLYISVHFLRTVTRKPITRKKKYVEKPMKVTSLQMALIKKEIGYFFSIPAYVMNAGMSTIMAILLGVGIIMRGNLIVEWLPRMFPDASTNLIALAVGSSLALCCTINDATAPSISLEGKTYWLLKSTPVKPMQVFIAKAVLAPLVSLPGVIFTVIASALTLKLTVADLLFVFFIPLIACMFSGFLGICVNLKIPRFDWSNEITVIKQSLSVIFTLLLSMFFTAIPFTVAIVPAAYLEKFSSVLAYGICIIYFVLLVCLEVFYLATDGKKIWNSF